MRLPRVLILTASVLVTAAPAFADATFFIGNTSTPSSRQVKGFAVGSGLLVIGGEFEYSSTTEKPEDAAPSLKTFMGNLLLQTPGAILGIQPYFTTGGGVYRESLSTIDHQETQFGVNTGGGAKISLIGPLRARLDYRVFKLKGSPMHDVVHRLYAGINLKF
jgi:hypothetical protein